MNSLSSIAKIQIQILKKERGRQRLPLSFLKLSKINILDFVSELHHFCQSAIVELGSNHFVVYSLSLYNVT